MIESELVTPPAHSTGVKSRMWQGLQRSPFFPPTKSPVDSPAGLTQPSAVSPLKSRIQFFNGTPDTGKKIFLLFVFVSFLLL